MQNNTFNKAFVGENLLIFASLPSTNDYLKEMLSNSTPVPDGTVIMAVQQTAGKGQQGASWQSRSGESLTFSLYLEPSFLQPMQQFALNMAISLAITDFIQTLVPPERVHIKWPNDVFIGDQKLGGVLIENSVQGMGWKYAIVGIGLNIFQENFPADLADRATSLTAHADLPHLGIQEPQALLPRLCHFLEKRYLELRDFVTSGLRGDSSDQLLFSEHLSEYLRRLYRYEQLALFEIGGALRQGVIRGVSPVGRLIVDVDGELLDFGLREIRYVIS